jgi:hypothetical protein
MVDIAIKNAGAYAARHESLLVDVSPSNVAFLG